MISYSPAPIPFLQNRHLQTVFRTLTHRPLELPPCEEIRIPVGGSVSLRGKLWRGDPRRLVVIYHGLGGHADSGYVVGAAQAVKARGLSALRMELRGAEQQAPFTATTYHSGLTEDLDVVVEYMRNMGFDRIFLVGFSLSANLILKWLGQGKKPIDSAFVVSPPVRLSACATLLDSRANQLYQQYFLRKLRCAIARKAEAHPHVFGRFTRSEFYRSIRDFDENVTAVFHGFSGAEDYYERSSSYPGLKQIRNRTAIIHAIDDPFLDSADLQEFAKHPPTGVEVHLFRRGGHVGFYEGPFRGHAVDRWVSEFFSRS